MKSPTGEVSFDFGGAPRTLVFDMKAIAFFEREADVSIVEALAALEGSKSTGRPPKISHLAFLMQAGLQRHHPELSADEAMAMAADPAVQQALGVGLQAAMPDGESAEGNGAAAQAGNGIAQSGIGTKSSKGRSKRG